MKIVFAISAVIAVAAFFAVNNLMRDQVRCTTDQLQQSGRVRVDVKRDYWFSRNTNGEVWWTFLDQKVGIVECQIR